MARSGDISFELERFEWVSADRLEVEGRWHGARRRLPQATLVVDVEGQRRRLRALPDAAPASAERWVAAFPWEGDMPVLPGEELEVGRGIVVDLPRPRRSKARGAAAVAGGPTGPIQASTREERDAIPGREEAERLLAVLTASRGTAEEAAARAQAAEAQVATLRDEVWTLRDDAAASQARAEEAKAELATLRSRAEAAEAELATLRSRGEAAEAELATLRSRGEAAEAELTTLRTRAEAAEAELTTLRSRPEEAEAEAIGLRARAEE